MNNEIAIVIPIYTLKFNKYEEISLKQCIKVLKSYNLFFVGPNWLKAQCEKRYKDIGYKEFDDSYFTSTKMYSRLCLEEKFYNEFIDYEYILIYQLDAFVFEDQLKEFIYENYDYIGAPLLNDSYWRTYHVGNGGLSLRKTQKCIEILREKDNILKKYKEPQIILDYEDHFWSYCGYLSEVDFRVPTIERAARFAMQNDSCNVYRTIKKQGFPFGVHMWWNGTDSKYWKNVICHMGYDIDINGQEEWKFLRKKRVIDYYNLFVKNRVGKDNTAFLQEIGISRQKKYLIWGRGKYGRYAYNLLSCLGVKIEGYIDNDVDVNSTLNEVTYLPNDIHISEYGIIVAVKYYQEIINQIKTEHISCKDIITYNQMQRRAEQILETDERFYLPPEY